MIRLLILTLLMASSNTHAQIVISADFDNLFLVDAFKKLEHKNNIAIAHDPSLVKGLRINAVFKDKSIQEAFDILLKECPLKAEVVRERYVIITPREKPVPPPVARQLCGQVKDIETGESLPFSAVFSCKTRCFVEADSSGHFNLSIPADLVEKDSILIQYFGYKTVKIAAHDLSTSPCKQVKMRASNQALAEIVIQDKAVEAVNISSLSQSKNELRPDKRGFVPALGEPDPFRILQFLPGVSAEGDKSGDLLVRGGRSDQNLILWEGIPIYHGSHVFGYISSMNPYIINKINIYKGNPSADFGGRASSVIDMRSDFKQIQKPTLSMGGNQMNGYWTFHTPLFRKKMGFMVSARYAESWKSPTFGQIARYEKAEKPAYIQALGGGGSDNDSILVRPSSTFLDNSWKFFWNLNSRHLVELSGYFTRDGVNFKGSILSTTFAGTEQSSLNNEGVSLRWNWLASSKYRSEVLITGTSFKNKYISRWATDTSSSMVYQFNLLEDVRVEYNNYLKASDNVDIQFGIQSNQITISNTDTIGIRAFNERVNRTQQVLYAQMKWAISPRFLADIGLRTTSFRSKIYHEPRIRLSWKLNKELQLHFNYGINRQFIHRTAAVHTLGSNTNIWLLSGTRGLKSFANTQLTGGGTYQWQKWFISAEYYYKKLGDLSGYNHLFNGIPQPDVTITGFERAYGMEFMLRRRWGHYTNWVSYTVGKSITHFDSLNNGNPFPADFSRLHHLKWNHHWGTPKWDFALTYHLQSGGLYTPVTALRDNNALIYGSRNSENLPSYHRIDLSVQYLFDFRRFRGSLGGTMFNVFDKTNHQYLQYTAYSNSLRNRHLYSLGRVGNIFLLLKF